MSTDYGDPGIEWGEADAANDDGEAVMRAEREAGEADADLPGACAWHGGEGDSGPGCPYCRDEQDPSGASAFRGHGPGCGCPDCEGARSDAGGGGGDPDLSGPVFGEAELCRADAYRDREGSDLD